MLTLRKRQMVILLCQWMDKIYEDRRFQMKKGLSILLTVCITLCMFSSTLIISTPAMAASSVIENAIAWAIATANDNSHGYSQSNWWGPDYDCSSFVITAFRNAGVNTGAATYTGNMRSQFIQHGFQWIP